MDQMHIQKLMDCRDGAEAGGKAVNLGRMIRAGFNVPGGFVVTAGCYAAARDAAGEGAPAIPPEVAGEIRAAYRELGGGLVAVRSSATAEDLAEASMAGQYETYLNIQGEDAVLEAVARCWRSVHSPRTAAYLREHQIDPATVAMAVVVQKLVKSDVAGVLFTANPAGPGSGGGGREMILEASWGLGESVVSGRVQPDVLRLDFGSGRILSSNIADKKTVLTAGESQERETEESRRKMACLSADQSRDLWAMGRRAEEHFGAPQDIEWAIEGGKVFLLQSRAITTLAVVHMQQGIVREMRERLEREAAEGRGPWVLHNLAETLAHPTPLTWSVMQRFMSGAGGFGRMYRRAGFAPSKRAEREGFLALIGGRIYMDAARTPGMFSEGFAFAYDAGELARAADPSQAPPTLPVGSLSARMKSAKLLAAVGGRLHALAATCEKELRTRTFPAIREFVALAHKTDLTGLSAADLMVTWRAWEEKVMTEFSAELLLPSMIAGMAVGELAGFLAEHFYDQESESLAQEISSGGAGGGGGGGGGNSTVMADQELYEVGKGTRTLAEWIVAHGHRGPGEFDLASPRWRETPSALDGLANSMAGGETPMERHEKHAADVARRVEQLRTGLSAAARARFDELLSRARDYLPFREDAKDVLILSYDLLRNLALEMGRRLGVGADVFLMTREEMCDALEIGLAPRALIEMRKLRRQAESRIKLPRMIGWADIPRLGIAEKKEVAAGAIRGFAVSTGRAKGAARLIHSPTEARSLAPGYILVCPSTDPSWTPLFVNAAGLVLECGGALSHGAVVAREMGLPAVVVADAMQLIKEGEEILVDGDAGAVMRAGDEAATTVADVNDVRMARKLLPPPVSDKDRQAGRIRNACAAAWGIYLLAFFFLPRVKDVSMAALDALLWPIVRAFGKPATVAIVAAFVAAAILLVQKLVTDNARLMLAKKRAATLQKDAAALPADAPRRRALLQAASGMQVRTLLAALVPVGILLGPLVMPFVWFKARLDPSMWSPPAGSSVQIVATVDGAFDGAVKLAAPGGLSVDAATPPEQRLPALRPALQHLLALYRAPAGNGAWEVAAGPEGPRDALAADLEEYLANGIPPQSLTWLLAPTSGKEDGRFPVTVSAGESTVTAAAVLGEKTPPADRTIAGPAGSPIKRIEVVYPGAKMVPPFWQPFKSGALAGVHCGWVLLYILAYLPVLFILRYLLRVA